MYDNAGIDVSENILLCGRITQEENHIPITTGEQPEQCSRDYNNTWDDICRVLRGTPTLISGGKVQ